MNKFAAFLRKLPRVLFIVFFMTFLMTSGYYACSDDATPDRDGSTDDIYVPAEDGQQLIDGMTSD